MKNLKKDKKTHRMRVAPKFQSVPLVLAGLQHRAKANDVDRHRKLLLHCMGHLTVSSDKFVKSIYHQALSMTWGSRSLDGLESIILSGIQNAFATGDKYNAEVGVTTLANFPSDNGYEKRPIIFLDRSTSMLTILTHDEYKDARIAIMKTSKAARLAWGIGSVVRAFNSQPSAAKTFDQATCKTWVNGILIVGGVAVLVLFTGAAATLGSGSATNFGRVIIGVGTGGAASAVDSLLGGSIICSGLEWIESGKRETEEPDGADEPEETLNTEPTTVDNSELNGGVEGTVEEGDGFTVTTIEGATTVTLTGSDGSTQTVTTDNNGNTTVTSTDTGGNVTDVTTYDSEGNQSSGGGYEEPPTSEGGYPVPDGDGEGGNRPFGPNPAAMTATLLAQPSIAGQQTIIGRGTTFLLNGAGQLNGSAFNNIGNSQNQF